jgi:hypothetical protein
VALGSINHFNSLAKKCIKETDLPYFWGSLLVFGGFMRKIIALILLIATPVVALAGDGWIDEKKGGRPRPKHSIPVQPL